VRILNNQTMHPDPAVRVHRLIVSDFPLREKEWFADCTQGQDWLIMEMKTDPAMKVRKHCSSKKFRRMII
jgi:hypothetical protein